MTHLSRIRQGRLASLGRLLLAVTVGVYSLVLGSLLALAPGPLAAVAPALAAPTPFSCNGDAYMIQAASATTPSQLFLVNTHTNPITFPTIGGPMTGHLINALGYRTTNNLLYAYAETTASPPVVQGVVTIDATGAVTVLGIPSGILASAGLFDVGAVSNDGSTLYLYGNTSTTLYKVNLTSSPLTATSVTVTSVNVLDLAQNPADGLLYGVDVTNHLVTINPATGATTISAGTVTGLPAGGGNYGANWFNADGTLDEYLNLIPGSTTTGELFQIALTPTPHVIASVLGPGAAGNDGASCASAPIAADLSLAKTASSTEVGGNAAFSYTLQVTNNGPDSANGATVTDTLPAGVTFVSASGAGWTCTPSGSMVGCTTTNVLPLGDAPPITINVTGPGTSGTVTNSATVTSPTTDPDATNNTSTADVLVDTVPPTCAVTAVIAGPPKQIQISVQDIASGLAAPATGIVLTNAVNATVNIPTYTAGTTSPVVVTATKIDQTMGASVTLTLTDTVGNTFICDPAATLVVGASGQAVQTISGLAQSEHTVTIINGDPGLRTLVLVVHNGQGQGRSFALTRLQPGQHATVDIAGALSAGDQNRILLVGAGQRGSSADVIIGG